MLRVLFCLVASLLTALPAIAQDADNIFPYETHVRTFDNGLQAIVIPTDFPNIVSLQIPVRVGSRDEVEEGKSGFAHFFEHMMFRGTETVSAAEYNARLKEAGADQNAYTTDDRTVYHLTFSKEDLDEILRLEADRFQNLQYSEADFRTEALAVLGEYNKNSANPTSKLFEVLRETAFDAHTYEHTTMGFLEDIEAMPDQFDYSLDFFGRFYRPENTAIIVAGDVEPAATFALIEQYWGDWAPGAANVMIPEEPAPDGPAYAHVAWESPTLPWVAVAFRGPAAFDEDGRYNADMAALDVLGQYAFGSTSDLYQRLVVDEQVVDYLGPSFPDRVDPYLVSVLARLKDATDLATVRDEIQKTLAAMRTQPLDESRIREITQRLRYGFANNLDDSESVAQALVAYVAATGDVGTINEVYRAYAAVTADDVQRVANTYFVDDALTTVTLAHGEISDEAQGHGSVAAHLAVGTTTGPVGTPTVIAGGTTTLAVVARQHTLRDTYAFETTTLPTSAPVLDVRLLFDVGAADDPEGKEGLATLTARMVADAGSEAMTYSEIQDALYPMAAWIYAQVDKEMTAFVGKTHRDTAVEYWRTISGQLLSPAFRAEDFQRVQSDLLNEIRVSLRANNDEELGKEVLYEMLYANHDNGHLNAGHLAAVEALTLADVRAFYDEHYTQANLTVALAGDLADDERAFFYEAIVSGLPEGTSAGETPLSEPAMPDGLDVTLVQKDTRAAAISMGFPIEVTRSHPDFAALWLVRSYFGEHRSTNSHLFQRIREARGMNYGDYAYIEYFPGGMYQFHPDPNLGRQQQIFQIWIRPVPPEQTHFALRIAKYELDKLVEDGMSEADFEATRAYLTKFVNVLTKSQGRQLGYALDSEYYGIPAFADFIKEQLAALTLADVNRVIAEHLQSENLAIVVVTPEAEALAARLVEGTPSPITYNAEKSADLLAEDEVIEAYPLDLVRDDIRIVDVDDIFAGPVFGVGTEG